MSASKLALVTKISAKKPHLSLATNWLAGKLKSKDLTLGWHFFKIIQMVFCIVFEAAGAQMLLLASKSASR